MLRGSSIVAMCLATACVAASENERQGSALQCVDSWNEEQGWHSECSACAPEEQTWNEEEGWHCPPTSSPAPSCLPNAEQCENLCGVAEDRCWNRCARRDWVCRQNCARTCHHDAACESACEDTCAACGPSCSDAAQACVDGCEACAR